MWRASEWAARADAMFEVFEAWWLGKSAGKLSAALMIMAGEWDKATCRDSNPVIKQYELDWIRPRRKKGMPEGACSASLSNFICCVIELRRQGYYRDRAVLKEIDRLVASECQGEGLCLAGAKKYGFPVRVGG